MAEYIRVSTSVHCLSLFGANVYINVTEPCRLKASQQAAWLAAPPAPPGPLQAYTQLRSAGGLSPAPLQDELLAELHGHPGRGGDGRRRPDRRQRFPGEGRRLRLF